MKTASALLLTLLTAMLFAAPLQAQTTPLCDESDTPLSCWLKYNPAPREAATQVAAVTQQRVAAANTGAPGVLSPASSAVKDFLSLLSASLESSTTSSNGQVLTFDYNPDVEILGTPDALKLQVSFAKPELNAKYTAALATNAAALQSANDDLTNTDDITFVGSFQPTSRLFGRSIEPHRPLFEAMLISQVPTTDLAARNAALVEAVKAGGIMSETQTFGSIPVATRAPTIVAFENAARQQAAMRKPLKAFSDVFARLLNNQPQLYASGIYEARKNIAGPNTFSGKVTYEMGAKNLNGFRRKFGTTCNETTIADSATADRCATLLATYAGAASSVDDRLVFSLQYDRSDQRWISDPALGLDFGYPRTTSLVYEVKYGRTMNGAITGTTNGRLDATVKYEDVMDDGDPANDISSRTTGSLTYTLKINDTVNLPLSLVYASDPADLTDTNRKLNAHFGLVLKLPTK
ncbi:MAG TPA: hypothetical protein VGF69_21785 [Thermoanaerobaculia bacterium]